MRIALVIAAVLIGAGLLWGAGELHYRNCVNTAKEQGAESSGAAGAGRPRGGVVARFPSRL
jgi:hypothetical protein